MSLSDQCRACHAPDWIGAVTVSPPTDFWANAWRRRTQCKHCGWAQDEVRGGTLLAITSRHEPIDWRGGNPFDMADEEWEERG